MNRQRKAAKKVRKKLHRAVREAKEARQRAHYEMLEAHKVKKVSDALRR